MAEDAVGCEPVSAPNSLLTGKLTGNLPISGVSAANLTTSLRACARPDRAAWAACRRRRGDRVVFFAAIAHSRYWHIAPLRGNAAFGRFRSEADIDARSSRPLRGIMAAVGHGEAGRQRQERRKQPPAALRLKYPCPPRRPERTRTRPAAGCRALFWQVLHFQATRLGHLPTGPALS